LAPDAVKFRKACEKAGVTGEWLVWEGQMHCFPLTFSYGMSEGKQGMDWVVGVLERNT
jgi:acetyl esterase/lipase